MANRFLDGLAALDGPQTRQRLAALLHECRACAPMVPLQQGRGLREAADRAEAQVLATVKSVITDLAATLDLYASGPRVTPPADAYAKARAEHDARAPAPAAPEPSPPSPAATRPVLPARPARLPPMNPGRPS